MNNEKIITISGLSNLLTRTAGSQIASLNTIAAPAVPQIPTKEMNAVITGAPTSCPTACAFCVLQFFVKSAIDSAIPPSNAIIEDNAGKNSVQKFLDGSP